MGDTMDNNFNFIDSHKNDEFSSFRGLDLQDLLVEIENFRLVYRDTLNLPSSVTFGVELEYEWVFKKIIDNFINKKRIPWNSKIDGSVPSGGEVSSRILQDDPSSWKELREVCVFLKRMHAVTTGLAGGHIHVGAHILEDDIDKWRRFLKIYAVYECVLSRFAYGDKVSGRKELLDCASPIAFDLRDRIELIDSGTNIKSLMNSYPFWVRERSLNFKNADFLNDFREGNTLEFRGPNATDEEVIWQNNINTFTKLILSPGSDRVDEEFLDFKLKSMEGLLPQYNYLYNEVNLEKSLEFVDLIFDNNLDKVYFLRQYIKGFENNFGVKGAVKSKRFIK